MGIDILLILLLQLIYVPVLTMRTIFLVRGMSVIASILGFMESLIYLFGLTLVFSGDKNPIILVFYAAGFGLGIFLGGLIEKKLAIGYTCLTVNLIEMNNELVDMLRDFGFGVTVFMGEGKDGKRCRLEILTKRNCEKQLMKLIEFYEPKAFIISYEPRRFKGGYLIKSMKKRVKNNELFNGRKHNRDAL